MSESHILNLMDVTSDICDNPMALAILGPLLLKYMAKMKIVSFTSGKLCKIDVNLRSAVVIKLYFVLVFLGFTLFYCNVDFAIFVSSLFLGVKLISLKSRCATFFTFRMSMVSPSTTHACMSQESSYKHHS